MAKFRSVPLSEREQKILERLMAGDRILQRSGSFHGGVLLGEQGRQEISIHSIRKLERAGFIREVERGATHRRWGLK